MIIYMNFVIKVIIIIFLFNNNTNSFAIESVDKIKKKSKNIFKTLTRKSLDKSEILEFLSVYVIAIDDNRGDGVVTYYFYRNTYKRYKGLDLISEDKWDISKSGHLKIFYKKEKNIWKIQPAKINTINIKKKFVNLGKLHEFSYENKTEFYLLLEEKKIKDN